MTTEDSPSTKWIQFGSNVTFQNICTVLDDSLDRFAILGVIPYARDGLAESLAKEDFEAELKNLGKEIEVENQEINRLQGILKECATLQRARQKLQNRIKERSFDYHFQLISARLIQEKLMFPGYLVKVEKDRMYINNIIQNTKKELMEKSSFNHLRDSVGQAKAIAFERETKLEICAKSEKDLLRVSRELLKVKQQLKIEVRDLDDIVEYMKVKRQKTKYENSLASKYTAKHTGQHVEQKMNEIKNTFTDMQNELNEVQEKIRLEDKSTKLITGFLKRAQSKHEEQLEYWMERYEQDVEVITKKLEQLRSARSQTWENALIMLRNYNQFETIVNDYKRQETLEKEVEDYEFNLLNSVVQIQSWWRLIMVLKRLGPFRKKKDKKKKAAK